MISKVRTAAPIGFDGALIEVEADIKAGLPSIQIVGMGNKSVDEARERVRSAIRHSLLDFPARKLTINLAPAELPKDGTAYDLPIAVAILVASGQLRQLEVDTALFAGELALDGALRPIRGALPLAEVAKRHGFRSIYLPSANCQQASLVQGVEIIGAATLQELFLHLKNITPLPAYVRPPHPPRRQPSSLLINQIQGHEQAKRALIIAAAGRHNLLMTGPPGVGKTMLAHALAELLPPLNNDEQIEVTKLSSMAKEGDTQVVTARPFRAPHHDATAAALIGGGSKPRPGEASLAHRGVLFLDELLEFPRATLEALRQPLESKKVSLARSGGHITFPADFMLVAATNPCPCGYLGDSTHECRCSATAIMHYQKKLSGPLLDRIDLQLTVSHASSFEHKLLRQTQQPKVSDCIMNTISRQQKRYKSSIIYNGNVDDVLAKQTFRPSPEATVLLDKAARTLGLSLRSRGKVLRVARTIADLAASTAIKPAHIAEALQFRGEAQVGSSPL